MIAMISPSLNVNGTLDWTVTDVNATTANLNVTRDITTSSGDLVTPATHHIGSFNESINLATRVASILPFIEPELNQALQSAQTNLATVMPTSTNWSSAMSAFDDTMMRQPLHTMWWVNGPLKVNDSVPVLVFPTNVKGTTNVDIGGSIGSRPAWTLVFNPTGTLPPPESSAVMASSIPFADGLEFALTFNYDQSSDVLLNATADIHFGFSEAAFIPPTVCPSTGTTAPVATICPATQLPIMREFGVDVQASLKLISTTLDLNQRFTSTGNPNPSSVPSSDSGPGTGPGGSQGPGSSSGPSSNPGPSPNPGSGHNPGSGGGTTTGGGQPANNPTQSRPTAQSAGLLPWMFGILGIMSAAIVATVVWFARRQAKKTQIPLASA